MSETQSLNAHIIYTSMAHENPVMGTNVITTMNVGLHCGERIDHTLFNQNQVRHDEIKS